MKQSDWWTWGALFLAAGLSGCYESETHETTLGGIGKQAISTTGAMVSRALFDKSEADREAIAARLAAEEVARQTAEAAWAERERRLERRAVVERELRRELDAMKADRRTLYEALDAIGDAGQGEQAGDVDSACPFGRADRIRLVVDWMRQRADGAGGDAGGGQGAGA